MGGCSLVGYCSNSFVVLYFNFQMVERFEYSIDVIEINGDTSDDFNESHFLRVFYRSVNCILLIILKFNEVCAQRLRSC